MKSEEINLLKIAPSLLSADMSDFRDEIEKIVGVADYVHCDVMDNHFVPNLTFGAPVIKAIKKVSRLPLDVHLMIENPDRWIGDFIDAGLKRDDILTFHLEAANKPVDIVNRIIDAGIRPGISIKPATDVDRLLPYIDHLSMILVMTVEPGFGGQEFMEDMMPKVSRLRRMVDTDVHIAVDGGIDVTTISKTARAGADFFIAGAAVFGQDDPRQAVLDLREAALKALHSD